MPLFLSLILIGLALGLIIIGLTLGQHLAMLRKHEELILKLLQLQITRLRGEQDGPEVPPDQND